MYSFANLFKSPEALFERPKVLLIKFGTELFRNNVIQKIRYINAANIDCLNGHSVKFYTQNYVCKT